MIQEADVFPVNIEVEEGKPKYVEADKLPLIVNPVKLFIVTVNGG